MLRVGVPQYRLPTEVIDREVQEIVDFGVELRLDSPVENVEELFAQGYDAVLIAVGAHEGIRLPIEGAELAGVLTNTSFLRDVRLGKPPELGGKVVVIGAGDVAMDCARTSVRLGRQVAVHYRRSREEAPADPLEIEHALEEGVDFHWLSNPVAVLAGPDGRVRGLRLQRMELGPPDEKGRRRPVPVAGSEYEVACDNVIFSVGQRAGLAFLPADAGVAIGRDSTITVDPETFATSRPGLFAAGDSTTGTAFLIDAVASGHRAARGIHAHLREEPLRRTAKERLPVADIPRETLLERADHGELRREGRLHVRNLDAAERRGSFEEVALGYTEEEARREAERCLSCGVCSECYACVEACKAGAVVHEELERDEVLHVGAVVLAPGYELYDARLSQEYGWGRYPNVVTAMQFERMLSASGPTHGHVKRPGDGKTPKRIAFLQCVGSRDKEHDYCSSVCCMYAAKEAIMAVEHEPGTEVSVFFMDTRSFSKGYDEYYRRARERYGIRYERCRVSRLLEDPGSGDLVVRYVQAGKIREEPFDLVVLSVGMEISPEVRELGRRLDIELDEYGFCHTTLFNPLEASRPGIFVAGPFREPKDIPETVVEASGAACRAGTLLAAARGSLTRAAEYPPERDVADEPPRIGVFVCHCGSNIGGFLDVPSVADYAKGLPGVAHAEANLYTCSQDTVAHITEMVREQNLNRVVVASCSPRTHEPLFQDAVRAAGLNPSLFEMANIRNQCSWVHSGDWDGATEKSMDLVRGAIARAARLAPVHSLEFPVKKSALVLGGGAAGMTAALAAGGPGVPGAPGGEAGPARGQPQPRALPGGREEPGGVARGPGATHREPPENRRVPRDHAAGHRRLPGQLHDHAPPGGRRDLPGRARRRGRRHRSPGVPRAGVRLRYPPRHRHRLGLRGVPLPQGRRQRPRRVGPAHGAAAARERGDDPVRGPCGEVLRPHLLHDRHQERPAPQGAQARGGDHHPVQGRADLRLQGAPLHRGPPAGRPLPALRRDRHAQRSRWSGTRCGSTCGREARAGSVTLRPEVLVLAEPMVPQADAGELATRLKVPLDADGFFLEAHVKLRPVDFQSDGLYVAGLAHYPKFLAESIAQAQAAAARAATVLSKDMIHSEGVVAEVDQEKCVGCLTCVRVCPYEVPKMQAQAEGVGRIRGAAFIEPATCHGCGVCAGECPAKAIQLAHYTDPQVEAIVENLFEGRAQYHGQRSDDTAVGGC